MLCPRGLCADGIAARRAQKSSSKVKSAERGITRVLNFLVKQRWATEGRVLERHVRPPMWRPLSDMAGEDVIGAASGPRDASATLKRAHSQGFLDTDSIIDDHVYPSHSL